LRFPGTQASGDSFTGDQIKAAWNRGVPVPGWNPDYFRKDACGAWIHWVKYGEIMAGGCGWQVDHIRPVALGGTDAPENLQPLQWQNNLSKGDDWPVWSCLIPERRQLAAPEPSGAGTSG